MSEMPVGAIFAGHRIEAALGRGGMGVVYRATQLDLERTVALKVVAPELLQDEDARRRFVNESRLAASIDHPHVIPIHYAGEEGGVPYLAMRYVPGDDCRSLVRRDGPIAPDRAARIVTQVAGALDAAHAAGLVHRDVKPANVLLGADDHAYLSDFGLTRHVRSVSGLTRTGQWVGTLDYVAPEQIRGGAVDARADVYALGCLLFFLLTGQVPFPRDGDEARLWAHLTEPPPRVTAVASGVPEGFEPVIARALAKAPDDRYPSAGDLGRAAVAAAAGVAVADPERAVARGPAAPSETRTRTTRRPRRRTRLRWLAAPVVAAALAAAVVVLADPFDDDPAGRPGPTPTPSPGATGPRVVATARAGSRPNSIAITRDHLWVGAWRSERMLALDVRTNRVVSGRRLTAAHGVADLALTDDALWVATRARRLVQLDPERGSERAPPIALTMDPAAMAARGDDVWVGQELDDDVTAQIVRVNATTGIVEAAVAASHDISGMLFARGWLWTLHGDPNLLVRRDPTTLRPRERIALPGASVGAVAFGAGALWVTIPDQDQLVRYQPRTGNRASVSVGGRPIGVAVHGGRVWVASSGTSTLDRVDTRTLQPDGEPLRVPLNPLTVAAGEDAIWVTCVGENVVARVDPGA